MLAARQLGAHRLLLGSPMKPPNLPAWGFNEGQLFASQRLQRIPEMSGRHQAKIHPAPSDSCCSSCPSLSAQDLHHESPWPGLYFQLYGKGTSHTYPEGAKLGLLNLHSVRLFKPPNLLDLVH